jgi:hypothetical protein
LKLPGRSEEALEKEIKLVKAISRTLIPIFYQKGAKIILKKKGCIHRKTYIGNIFEKNKVYKYLGIEISDNKEDKNE